MSRGVVIPKALRWRFSYFYWMEFSLDKDRKENSSPKCVEFLLPNRQGSHSWEGGGAYNDESWAPDAKIFLTNYKDLPTVYWKLLSGWEGGWGVVCRPVDLVCVDFDSPIECTLTCIVPLTCRTTNSDSPNHSLFFTEWTCLITTFWGCGPPACNIHAGDRDPISENP